MSKIFKNSNLVGHEIKGCGETIPANGQIDLSNNERLRSCPDAIEVLYTPGIVYNDGTRDLSISDAINHIRGFYPQTIYVRHYPFAEKKTKEGNSLFARPEGKEYTLVQGDNTLSFQVTWQKVKFDEIEIIGCEKGDKVKLKVLDDHLGTYSGVPFAQLNQFGKNVATPDGYYKRKCDYDADLYGAMWIEVEYKSKSAKTIDINYVLHEVK